MQSNTSRIFVLGAGSWGTALALQLARNNHDVTLWGHNPKHIQKLESARQNARYLPNIRFPDCLNCTHVLEDMPSLVLVAVPSFAFVNTIKMLQQTNWNPSSGIAWATKGIDVRTRQFLHQKVHEIFEQDMPMAVLSGPTFANEVARNLPTALTIAGNQNSFSQQWAQLFFSPNFRCYTSADITGVEIAGATKNVIAIAAGVSDGLGFGANARSAIITRGLSEIMRLGKAYQAENKTFMGLAGLGDLSLTCSNNQSRNRQLGLLLAKNLNLKSAQYKINQAIEGANVARAIQEMSQHKQVEMPITNEVVKLLDGLSTPQEAAQNLLNRSQVAE